MREVEKKDALKAAAQRIVMPRAKGKALQNRLSKVESQIKQLEKDIQHDDKMLASNYNKILKMLLFKAYNKRKQSWKLL
jgi:ATP-binding cassette subfamily F protein 3